MSFPASGGLGNRGWGQIPWGDGPYLPFTFTPGYNHAQGLGYEVEVFKAEDQREQRVVGRGGRMVALRHEWDYVSSADVVEISSHYLAAGGPLRGFTVTDFRTGRPYVARYGGPLTVTRGQAMRCTMAVQWAIDRPVTLPEVVLQTGPVPIGHWRLTEAPIVGTDSSAAFSTVNTGAAYYSNVMAGPALLPFGADGHGWFTPNSNSGVVVASTATYDWKNGSTEGYAVEVVLQPSQDIAGGYDAALVSHTSGVSSSFELQLGFRRDAGAFVVFTWDFRQALTDTLLEAFVEQPPDCSTYPAHVMARISKTSSAYMDVWVSGTMVGSRAYVPIGAATIQGGSIGIGCKTNSGSRAVVGAGFYGLLGEVAVYSMCPEPAFIRLRAAVAEGW